MARKTHTAKRAPKTKAPKREPSAIGLNIRRIRLAKGMTQQQLADAMELEKESGRVYVNRVESGAVGYPHENLRRFADALGVSMDELNPPRATRVDLDALIEEFKASEVAKDLRPPWTEDDLKLVRGSGRAVATRPGAGPTTIRWLIEALRRTDTTTSEG